MWKSSLWDVASAGTPWTKREGWSWPGVQHPRLASSVFSLVQNPCNSVGEKTVVLPVCRWNGSREDLCGRMARTCRPSESVKEFDNSVIGLPVMEDDFRPSLSLTGAGDLKGAVCYGWFLQTTSALQNSVSGVHVIKTETSSVQRDFSPLLNLDLGKTHMQKMKTEMQLLR